MNVINNIIFNLLAAHKSIYLPEIGTLRVVQEKTEENGIFFLSNKITVTDEVNYNLNLIEKIRRSSDIPVKDIIYNYNKWLEEIKDGDKIVIPRVGIINKNKSVFFQIEPELDNALNGIIPEVAEETQKNMAVEPVVVQNQENKNDMESSVNIPLPTEAEAEQLKKIPEKTVNKRRFIFAVILLIACALGAYYYYIYRNDNLAKKEVEVSESTDIFVEFDSPKENETEEMVPVVSFPIYHVIGGVFSTKENAERFIEGLGVKTNYDPVILPNRDRFMVSLIRFDNKDDAVKEIRKTPSEYREIWIYEQNK